MKRSIKSVHKDLRYATFSIQLITSCFLIFAFHATMMPRVCVDPKREFINGDGER